MLIGSLINVTIKFDASGKNDDNWRAGCTTYYTVAYDTTNPVQMGMAPMAFSQYKKGDKITITVRFSEIVTSGSGVSVNSIPGLYASGWTLVGGYGTNALTFTGTVTSDFEITPDSNNTWMTTKPLSGTFNDFQ
jgi:hypothetical protein